MIDTKSLFKTKTFWGGALSLAAGVLGIFGYTLTPDAQNALMEAGFSIAAALGGILAIYGRAKATKVTK